MKYYRRWILKDEKLIELELPIGFHSITKEELLKDMRKHFGSKEENILKHLERGEVFATSNARYIGIKDGA